MAKAIIIELTATIPDTEQNKVVTLDIEGRMYTGKVSVILTYTPTEAASSSLVTLSGNGLKVVSLAP